MGQRQQAYDAHQGVSSGGGEDNSGYALSIILRNEGFIYTMGAQPVIFAIEIARITSLVNLFACLTKVINGCDFPCLLAISVIVILILITYRNNVC
ncbi:membrane protein [Candidatus Magnetobacterium bavaricum]|uniref:Membrane protein n=1 Tax=Candidatus Magnetobacterium bavaricum TaxID=29290 RepID=A0A0F3GYP5_9BACT|nr:membrane protein [Candidatus Magnetobacterium bavaricum]